MSKQMTKGEKIGEILEEIEICMWEHQANDPGEPLKFNETALRAATKIFADILMEFSYRHRKSNKQKLESIPVLLRIKKRIACPSSTALSAISSSFCLLLLR